MLIGNVGKEPDVRYYDHDQAVAQFPLATTERGYTLQNGTKVPDHTDWHTIMVWRGLAKIVEKYVHKGDKLYIEGEIRTRSYQDKKGTTRYITEIWGKEMQMLSSKPIVESAPTGNTETDKQEENATTSDKSSLPF